MIAPCAFWNLSILLWSDSVVLLLLEPSSEADPELELGLAEAEGEDADAASTMKGFESVEREALVRSSVNCR